MILFQQNPKAPDFARLLVDNKGLQDLELAISALRDNKPHDFSNDGTSNIFGLKLINKDEIDKVYVTSPRMAQINDLGSLVSCAFVTLVGITLGVSFGTIIFEFICKLTGW